MAYNIARNIFPDSINLKKSKLKEEKVVKPPKNPIVINTFNCSLIIIFEEWFRSFLII